MSTQVKFYIVSLLIGFTILSIRCIKLTDELKKCQTDNYHVDGGDIKKEELQDSLFILQSNLGRYEMALEILKEKDSLSAQKFENVLFTETE